MSLIRRRECGLRLWLGVALSAGLLITFPEPVSAAEPASAGRTGERPPALSQAQDVPKPSEKKPPEPPKQPGGDKPADTRRADSDKPGAEKPAPAGPRVAFEIVRGKENWGRIVFELDEAKAPITTRNFLRYVDEGYFDGTLIHRVLVGKDARINIFQGGGYTELNGKSKPGQHEPIKLESQNGLKNLRGTIAMAREAAPDTATSEYFVNLEDNPKLDYASAEKPGYCVFGHIVDGWDVVDRIKSLEVRPQPDPDFKGEKSQPLDPPRVSKAKRL